MAKKYYILLLFCFLITQSILADGIIKEQSFSTSQGKTLTVKSACGDVNISTWSKNEAYIKITGNDNAKEDYSIDIEEKDGNIYVTTKKVSNTNSNKNISLKIEANIPEKYNAQISTAGGNLSLKDLIGNVEMKTAGGNIDIKNITGNIELKTAGGDIAVETFAGNLSAKTAGGNISLSGSEGSIEAKTAGGDISLRYSGDNKGIELKTSGGNINLYLPENISANIDFKTSSGKIDMGFEYSGKMNKSKSKLEGKINNGGEHISCKTSGGNISVKKIK